MAFAWVVAWLLACFSDARAVDFPEVLDSPAGQLTLNGVGLRQKTVFNVDVYLAALYTKTRSNDADTILASIEPRDIELVFLRDVSAADIVNSWNEGFAENCPGKCEPLADRLRRLNGLMVDVKNGQRVSLTFTRDALLLQTPGKDAQAIPGGDFARTVLATFIGVPPSKELKKGLLGLLPMRTLGSN